MGLTIADVANLNRSMENLGNSFEQRRRDDIASTFRKGQLDIEQRRLNAESDRAKAIDKQADIADKKDMLQAVMKLNASGQLDDQALTGVNQWLASDPSMKAMGLHLVKSPTPAQGLARGAVAEAEQVASKLEESGNKDGATRLRAWSQATTAHLQRLAEGPPDTETVTKEFDAVPPKEATSGGLFGDPTPYVPGTPKTIRKTTKHIATPPPMSLNPYPPAPTNAPPAAGPLGATLSSPMPAASAVTPPVPPGITSPLTLPTQAPATGLIRVRGPNGETGTAHAGKPLPPGWTAIQ